MSALIDLVQSLIDRGGESQDLDYKGPIPWPPAPVVKWGLVQDLMALSNTKDGGHILLGIEDRTGKVRGFSEGQAASWDQSKVYEVVKAHSSPVPRFLIQRVAHPAGILVLITVGEFSEVPHICSSGVSVGKDEILRPGGIYIRTLGAQSKLVSDVEEITELFDRARRKHPEFLDLLERIEEQKSKVTDAYAEQIALDRQGFGSSDAN